MVAEINNHHDSIDIASYRVRVRSERMIRLEDFGRLVFAAGELATKRAAAFVRGRNDAKDAEPILPTPEQAEMPVQESSINLQ